MRLGLTPFRGSNPRSSAPDLGFLLSGGVAWRGPVPVFGPSCAHGVHTNVNWRQEAFLERLCLERP
jgi:hypothetical protein